MRETKIKHINETKFFNLLLGIEIRILRKGLEYLTQIR
jgi:hypothetical protein